MKFLLPFILLAAASTSCHSLRPDSGRTPASAGSGEIRYKRQSSAVNEVARQQLLAAFSGGSDSVKELFPDAVTFCGSGCWTRVDKSDLKAMEDYIPATSHTPLPNGRLERDGAMIHSEKGMARLAESLVRTVGRKPRVRPLTSREIELYWALIPFSLEDPLLIVEGKGRRVVANLGGSKKGDRLAHVEDLSAFDEKAILGR
jgi:hypothetical protein